MIIYPILLLIAGLGAAWCAHHAEPWGCIAFSLVYFATLAELAMAVWKT